MVFRGETSGGVAKSRLFSQATFSLDLRDFNFLQLCDFESDLHVKTQCLSFYSTIVVSNVKRISQFVTLYFTIHTAIVRRV